MNVMMMWHGGSSYAAPDHETGHEYYGSLADAVEEFIRRPNDHRYPCVDCVPPEQGGPEAWVFWYDRRGAYDYPDRIIKFGPRGGVRVERA